MEEVVIVAAGRTAIGSFKGSLSSLTASALGTAVIKGILEPLDLDLSEISEVIMGQILTGGQGQNPARQSAIGAGIPVEVPACTLNQVCGSGLRAVAWGLQSIQTGSAKMVVAGGQESMSRAVHCAYLRGGIKVGEVPFSDSMITDGLWDAFHDCHMGDTAETLAKEYSIGREQQDEFAVASQNKAEQAQKAGKFRDEIVSVLRKDRKGEFCFEEDEHIRYDTTFEKLSALRPAFAKDGTVTGGNASGMNDGAAAVLLMSAQEARERGFPVLARVVSWAHAGVDPRRMGMGPVPASHAALARAGWSVSDLDLIEANEAFAVQAIAVNQAMGWPAEKVNVNGGAIALGHPIGASGCRILVTLLQEMSRRDVRRGLATLCIGGGMGIALCVERPSTSG